MNPYLWLAGLVFVAFCSAGSYRIGAKVERSVWQGKESARLAETNRRVNEVHEAAAREHHQHELALAAVGTALSKERLANEALRRSDRDRALAGDLRLRDPGARGCPITPESAAATAGRSDGPAPGELSREAAAFLFDLANDADEVARQLASCQAVVEDDRK